jgi:hypothetical protein
LSIPKFIVTSAILTVLTGGFSGCASSARNVPLTHFPTEPTVQKNWPQMTLTIPYSVVVSELNISPTVKVEGDHIIVSAKYVRIDKPGGTTFTFDLAKLGMPKEKASSAKVFWMNPDGTKHALEIKPKTAVEK